MSTRRPRREPYRFLLHIVGEQGATLPLDLMAHVAARERGEQVRDYTFRRECGEPWTKNAHQDKTVLETVVTDREALAILDALGIHREGGNAKSVIPKYVRTALDSLDASGVDEPMRQRHAFQGEVVVKRRHLVALLGWIEKQIKEGRL